MNPRFLKMRKENKSRERTDSLILLGSIIAGGTVGGMAYHYFHSIKVSVVAGGMVFMLVLLNSMMREKHYF